MIGLSGTASEKSLLTLIFSPPPGTLMCWYAMRPSFVEEGMRGRAELYKTQLEIEHALDEPDRRDEHDRSRAADEDDALVQPGRAQRVSERQKCGNDRQLPRLHPQIEADQRDEQGALRQAEVGEHAREAEAMAQTEAEGEQPAPAVHPRP